MRYLIIFLLLFSKSCFAYEVISNWETQIKSDRVVIQYRWVLADHAQKTREMRIVFSVHSTPDCIVSNIRDAEKVKQWIVGVREYKTYSVSDNIWRSYSLYSIPKPFTQQDLVTTQYQVINNTNNTVVKIKAIPDFINEVSGVKRLQHYDSKWILQKTGKGITKVAFYSSSNTKPMLPRFIQDPIIQRLLINSFEEFIKLTENENLAEAV